MTSNVSVDFFDNGGLVGAEFDNEIAKLGIDVGQELLVGIINGAVAYHKATQELDAANEEAKLGWFGAGGTYTIGGGNFNPAETGDVVGVSFAGRYNPDTIRLMAQWEEKGLGSIPIWGSGNECLSADETRVLLDCDGTDINAIASIFAIPYKKDKLKQGIITA